MKKAVVFLLIIFLMFTFCSCGYSRHVNEMAYVVGLGIDKGEEKDILLSVQFAKPMVIGSSGGGGEEGDNKKNQENSATSLVSAEGEDIFSAIRVLERSLSKQINLTHTKILIFSEEIAKEGVLNYVRSLMSNNQFRPNTYIAVARDSAKDYFKEVKPILEQNPAKYYTLMFSKDTKSVLPEATLLDLFYSISKEGKCAVLPVLKANKDEGQKEDGEKTGENKTDTGGMAVFSGDKLQTVFSEKDAESYNILTGAFREGYYDLKKDGKTVCVRLKTTKKPKIKVKKQDNMLKAEVKIVTDADPLSFDGSAKEIEDLINESLREQINGFVEKNKEEMCDTVGFGNMLKKSFLTYNDWKDYNYMEKFSIISLDVNVKTRVGSGLIKQQ